ncbi:hypothetical protein [Petropleomorpha daqingensis]|uniref:PEGA domain-containing protein n=1 Tax=Petropleomorpha daqingensis TaxID=2026353 RepID=A0A853CQV5_9ACTN|nr:hypothetical protein [Petropleomorpha daqingensis]NYJ08568.1 hypothetical protein [Petropleomorpha daqingensis]
MTEADVMADEGRLVIERSGGKYRDSLRSYEIRVDGVPVGQVGPGSLLDLPVTVGGHQVSAHIDWTGSDPVNVDIATGQAVRLRVEPTGASGLATLFKKKAYLRLTPTRGAAQAS